MNTTTAIYLNLALLAATDGHFGYAVLYLALALSHEEPTGF